MTKETKINVLKTIIIVILALNAGMLYKTINSLQHNQAIENYKTMLVKESDKLTTAEANDLKELPGVYDRDLLKTMPKDLTDKEKKELQLMEEGLVTAYADLWSITQD